MASTKANLEAAIGSVADAIRESTGGSDALTLDEMVEALEGLASDVLFFEVDGISFSNTNPSRTITFPKPIDISNMVIVPFFEGTSLIIENGNAKDWISSSATAGYYFRALSGSNSRWTSFSSLQSINNTSMSIVCSAALSNEANRKVGVLCFENQGAK